MTWESLLIEMLSASLLRPVALAVAAWLVLRIFRVRHPASKHAVWTAVLAAMVLLPVMSVIAPHWTLPVLPAKPVSAPPAVVTPASFAAAEVVPQIATVSPTEPAAPSSKPVSSSTLLVWSYLAGVLAMLLYRAAGWMMLRRVVAQSTSVRGTALRESSDVVTPVAVGVLRPTVLLPVGWRAWSPATRRAVLAHEFAHIRRRDTLIAALARLVKSALWFHPLAWWIARQVSELAEQSCDAVALERMRDPGGYSRILLEFASGVNRAGYRVALPGLAMAASSSGMSKRIDQVFELSRGSARKLARPGVLLASIGFPVMAVAATVGLGEAWAPLSTARLAAFIRTPSVPLGSQMQIGQVQIAQVQPKPVPPPDRNAPRPRFDTASIEVAGPPVSGELCWNGCGGPLSPYPESRNQISYRHFTLKKILLRAYDLKEYQIFGPASIDTTVYNVEATAAPGTPQDQFQLMLRNLLAERLQLTVHQESKDYISGYDLVVANGGPKLKEIEGPEPAHAPVQVVAMIVTGSLCLPGRNGVGYECNLPLLSPNGTTPTLPAIVTSVPDLSVLLSYVLDSPVADKTGLIKRYDIDLTQLGPASLLRRRPPHAERRAEEPASYADVRSGLEKMGLTLEEKRTPTTLLVVDSFDSAPAVK